MAGLKVMAASYWLDNTPKRQLGAKAPVRYRVIRSSLMAGFVDGRDGWNLKKLGPRMLTGTRVFVFSLVRFFGAPRSNRTYNLVIKSR
jgi:hypothetical protein